jgi:hypothetical protein
MAVLALNPAFQAAQKVRSSSDPSAQSGGSKSSHTKSHLQLWWEEEEGGRSETMQREKVHVEFAQQPTSATLSCYLSTNTKSKWSYKIR